MSTALSANPQYVNSVTSGTDTSIVNSLSGGGLTYSTSEAPVVTSNSHIVATRADGALWDITSAAYVSIQNTTIGTTTCPKNGQ